MRYVTELVNQIYVKVYGFLSFAKYMGKKYGQTLLYTTKNQQLIPLRLSQIGGYRKQQKQRVICLEIKL